LNLVAETDGVVKVQLVLLLLEVGLAVKLRILFLFTSIFYPKEGIKLCYIW